MADTTGDTGGRDGVLGSASEGEVGGFEPPDGDHLAGGEDPLAGEEEGEPSTKRTVKSERLY